MLEMPSGEHAPQSGELPASVVAGARERAFGVYVHIPFCAVRCGYCDFNTYTAHELGSGASLAAYAKTATGELALAQRVLAQAELPSRPVRSVFFGGGTPTLLPTTDLIMLLARIRDTWGLAPEAEVTVEANPDSVTEEALVLLAAAGFTRISLGMQSAVPQVLDTLDRTHRPERVPVVVTWAKSAGLSVSVDLIYGAPGESRDDWQRTLDAAIELDIDHVSAYALVLEEGTKMAAQVRRGELPRPSADDEAAKYEQADSALASAGFAWYEISNWARTPSVRSVHNLGYWHSDDWWGIGPGAHSHIGGVRWWNVRHPIAYADRMRHAVSPALAREVLTDDNKALERILLETRLSDGVPLDAVDYRHRGALANLMSDGLIEDCASTATSPSATTAMVSSGTTTKQPTVKLTLRGRLLADTVVRALT